jgi:hypothetical protein
MLLFELLKTRGAAQLMGVAIQEVFTQEYFTDSSWFTGQCLLPRGDKTAHRHNLHHHMRFGTERPFQQYQYL